jgi:hypothetical protein
VTLIVNILLNWIVITNQIAVLVNHLDGAQLTIGVSVFIQTANRRNLLQGGLGMGQNKRAAVDSYFVGSP